MPKGTTNTLTAAFVKGVRHGGVRKGADRHHDRHGLFLQVMPGRSSKQWIQRLVIDGKRSDYGLGSYPYMTLGEARLQAFENFKAAHAYRRARDRGESPPLPPFEANRRTTVARRYGEHVPALAVAGLTFGQAFEKVLEERAPTWKASVRDSSLRSWRANLRDYLQGVANLPIATLTSADLQACLAPVWAEKPKTAAKVLRRAGTVCEWAIVAGYRTDNPARAVARARPRTLNGVAHYKALPHREIALVLEKVAASGSNAAVKGAFRLQVLTAVRGAEVRLADWSEIDLDRAVWTIPGERMKYGRDHRVPLSPQAIEVLREAGPRAAGLVFEGRGGKPVSESAFRKMIERHGIDGNPHAIARSSFRDWAAEAGWPREVAEAALAHTVGGVEAAYMRSDLFTRRKALMAAWGEYAAGGAR